MHWKYFKTSKQICVLILISLNSIISYAEEIRIAYSDLLPEAFNSTLQSFSESNDLNIETTRMGSLPILEEFLEGQFDLCVIAMPDNVELPKLDDTKYNLIPLAYKTAVVVVNKDNPIRQIRLDQLSAIFGSQEGQSLKNWRDLDISGYAISSIAPFVPIEENGITSELFRHTVLSSYDYAASVRTLGLDLLKGNIANSNSAIGILPNDPEISDMKVLFVSKDKDSIAYGPTSENIYFGDYPIQLPFYILYNLNDSKRLLPMISYLLKDEIEDVLTESSFYPVPKAFREKFSVDMMYYMQENEL